MRAPEVLILLLAAVAAFALLARRLAVPYPILLVLGGLMISFIPGLPPVRLDPDLVLLIFLPPLLFAQAWSTPWREFWSQRRSIFLLAFGLVLFTATAVAAAANALLGMAWAPAFVLGAIVSPPDAVAVGAVAERLGLPRRVVTVLEGESLVNDATGLVAYKFAVAAVLTGTFSFARASVGFIWVVAAGVAIGWLVAWISASLFRRVRDDAVMITLSLLVPNICYLAAERCHASGVLAVVTAGLFLGWRAPKMLTPSARLQAGAVWELLVFLLNSIIFLLIGLQLPAVKASLSNYSLSTLLLDALAIVFVVILIRPIWVFPGAYLPYWLSPRIRGREVNPSWRNVTVVAWSGMRGVVSLAAAMALPVATDAHRGFPHRDLILFLTFMVILGTLVGQGLTLGPLIRRLGVSAERVEEKHEAAIRVTLAEAAQAQIDRVGGQGGLPETAIVAMRAEYQNRIRHLSDEQAQALGWSSQLEELVALRRLRREALKAERSKLIELHQSGKIPQELRYQIERELDLEEAKLG